MKGKLGGQHKVPRLSNERQHVEEILQLLRERGASDPGMKRLLVILFLFTAGAFRPAEDFHLLHQLPVSGNATVTTDPLGNCYLTVGNQVLKFDPKGKPLSNFAPGRSGRTARR